MESFAALDDRPHLARGARDVASCVTRAFGGGRDRGRRPESTPRMAQSSLEFCSLEQAKTNVDPS